MSPHLPAQATDVESPSPHPPNVDATATSSYGSFPAHHDSLGEELLNGVFSPEWRLFHGINYFLGGIQFFFGSILYFPYFKTSPVINATLYSFGSLNFLLADTQEFTTWAALLRPSPPLHKLKSRGRGKKARTGSEEPMLREGEGYEYSSCYGGEDEAATGGQPGITGGPPRGLVFNLFLSMTGSLLYLIGSVAFYPQLQAEVIGEWGFIVGSAIIAVSQAWKVHRIGLGTGRVFKLANLQEDSTGFGLEANAGVGGLCYLAGTVMYMRGAEATHIFITWAIGGTLFALSGSYLMYRHFVLGI